MTESLEEVEKAKIMVFCGSTNTAEEVKELLCANGVSPVATRSLTASRTRLMRARLWGAGGWGHVMEHRGTSLPPPCGALCPRGLWGTMFVDMHMT